MKSVRHNFCKSFLERFFTAELPVSSCVSSMAFSSSRNRGCTTLKSKIACSELTMTMARHFFYRICAPHPNDGTVIGQAGHQFAESVRVVSDVNDDRVDVANRAQISTTQ